MITEQQMRKRLTGVYHTMKKRFGRKYWNSGSRRGMIRVTERNLPFQKEEFIAWAMKHVGLTAVPCPYCGAPIDGLSFECDHGIPASAGGSVGLDNLIPCCSRCNRMKAALTSDDFRKLRAFIPQLSPSGQVDLERRLCSGAMGIRLRHFAK